MHYALIFLGVFFIAIAAVKAAIAGAAYLREKRGR